MLHLLNCRVCDHFEVVEGASCVADVRRELHEDSIRNWRVDSDELCPEDSVAWVTLGPNAEVNA